MISLGPSLSPGPVPFSPWRRILSAFAVAFAASAGTAAAQPAASVDGLPIWRLEEELRIGGDAGGAAPFARVGAIAVAANGEIFVLDAEERQIRVYSESGDLLRRFGAQGEGPGQFEFPDTLGLLGDTVWVTDSGNRRMTLFASSGRYLASIGLSGPMAVHEEMLILMQPARPRPDGTFEGGYTVIRQVGGARPSPADSMRVPRLRFDAGGRVLDTLGWTTVHLAPPGNPTIATLIGWRAVDLPNPFHDLPLRAEHEGERVIVERPLARTDAESFFSITRGLGGDAPPRTRRYRYRPIPTDPAEADAIVRFLAERAPDGGITPAQAEQAIRAALDVPPYQAPVIALLHTRDGGLWLLRGSADEPGQTRWTMLDPAGDPVGDVELPLGLTAHVSTGARLWGVLRDEKNVQYVVRYRLVKRSDS